MEPAAQDQSEPFDLVDEHGAPLGRTKPRGEVHRDGDWHRSLHVWVVLRRGPRAGEPSSEPWVVLQRRAHAKDTWPGALDVAVTGHLRAGEALVDGLREAEEEIGWALGPADVVPLGRRRKVDERTPGLRDREHQDILLAMTDRPLGALRPSPAEVDSLVALPLAGLTALLAGEVAQADGWASSGGEPHRVTVRAAELIPAEDGYYARALESIRAHLDGAAPPVWRLG